MSAPPVPLAMLKIGKMETCVRWSVLPALHRGGEGRNTTPVTRPPGFETWSGYRIVADHFIACHYRKDLLWTQFVLVLDSCLYVFRLPWVKAKQI